MNCVINLIYNHFFVLTVKIVHIFTLINFFILYFFGNEGSQKAFIKCIVYSESIIKLFLLEKSSFEWKDIIKVKSEESIYTGKSISYIYTTFCIIETLPIKYYFDHQFFFYHLFRFYKTCLKIICFDFENYWSLHQIFFLIQRLKMWLRNMYSHLIKLTVWF